MDTPTNNTKSVASVINFLEKIKTKYYGNSYRELPVKTQNHIQVAVHFNYEYHKAKLEARGGG